MKFKLKKKILLITGISAVSLSATLPLASCSYYKSWNKDNSVDNGNSDQNINNTYQGSIDSKIADSKIISSTDPKLVELNANNYGLVQNSNDFASNGDFSQINGIDSKLEDDIIGFLNILYFSNNKQISVSNSEIKNFKVEKNSPIDKSNESSNLLKLNESKISFDLTATISSGDSLTKINFPWGQEDLAPNSSEVLKISVSNQIIKSAINEMNEKYYLGWKVEKANVSFLNKTIEVSNLDLTYNSFSKAFYVQYNNLSNINSYFDLQNKYLPDLSKSLTETKFKDLFSSNVDNQQEDFFFYADMTTSIVKLIGDNTPIDVMLKTASKYLIQILVHMNFIPSEFEDILIEALYGKSNDGSTITSEPFINVLYNNRDKIFELLKKYLGSAYDVIEPIIGDIKPGMSQNDKGFLSIKNYVDMLLANIKNDEQKKIISEIIYGDILGVNGYGSPKSLWDIIITRYQSIIEIIQSNTSGFSSDLSKNILNILNIIFKTSEGKYSSIIDAIFSTNESKKIFLDAILSLVPNMNNIKPYLDILITNNDGLNKDSVLALINAFKIFLSDMFAYNDKATSNTKYNERYKNLSFTSKWNNASIDNKNMTATYSYSINISLTKKLTLDLSTIKNLVSKKAFDDLVKKIITNLINNDLVVNAVPSLLNNLQSDLFNIIPNSIIFSDGDKNIGSLTYTYTGSNEKIWFSPIKWNSDYYNGFSIGYNMNIFYNDKSLWNSISSNFTKSDFVRKFNLIFLVNGSYTLKYYDFWKSILENILMRSYNILGRFNSSDYSEKISDVNNYNLNYYYTNLVLNNNSSSINIESLNNLYSLTNSNNFETNQLSISWKGSNNNSDSENLNIKALKPNIDNNKEIFKNMYSIEDVINNKNYNILNYGYDFSFSPLLNCSIPLEVSLEANAVGNKFNFHYKILLNTSAYLSTLYFPVNFYDATNKKLVTSITKNYSQFNVNAQEIKNN